MNTTIPSGNALVDNIVALIEAARVRYALGGQRSPMEITKSGGASKRGSHRLAQVGECPRAWFFRWVRRLLKWNFLTNARDEPYYFRQGTLVHIALAYYYAAIMADPPSWFREIPLDAALQEAGAGDPADIKLAKEVLAMYHQRGNHDGMIPLAVEYEFEASIGEIEVMLAAGIGRSYEIGAREGDEQLVTARIDLLAGINGKRWINDYKGIGAHKGKGQYLPRWNDDGEYAIKWQLLVQLLVVRAALHAMGDTLGVEGVLIQRIKRIPPYDTDRNTVMIPHRPYREAIDTIRYQCLLERDLVAQLRREPEGWQPRGHFWSCYAGGRACDYRQICLATEPDQIKWIMDNEYKVLEG